MGVDENNAIRIQSVCLGNKIYRKDRFSYSGLRLDEEIGASKPHFLRLYPHCRRVSLMKQGNPSLSVKQYLRVNITFLSRRCSCKHVGDKQTAAQNHRSLNHGTFANSEWLEIAIIDDKFAESSVIYTNFLEMTFIADNSVGRVLTTTSTSAILRLWKGHFIIETDPNFTPQNVSHTKPF